MNREEARPTEEEIRELMEEEGSLHALSIASKLSYARGRTSLEQTKKALKEGDFIENRYGRWRPVDWDI